MAESAPSSKRRKSQTLYDLNSSSPHANISLGDDLDDSLILPENKDVDEKKKLKEMRKRRSSVHNIVNDKKVEKPGKSALTNMSESDRLAHYKLCIKLSEENKLNPKNAFGLHLIDFLGDMLHSQDSTNFQLASLAIHASANIFAARVDGLHSDTLKTASSLTVKKNKETSEEPCDDMDERRNVRLRPSKKKRGSFIVEDYQSLNAVSAPNHGDKTNACAIACLFEENCLNGLMQQLPIQNDNTCEILLCDSHFCLEKKSACNYSPDMGIPETPILKMKKLFDKDESQLVVLDSLPQHFSEISDISALTLRSRNNSTKQEDTLDDQNLYGGDHDMSFEGGAAGQICTSSPCPDKSPIKPLIIESIEGVADPDGIVAPDAENLFATPKPIRNSQFLPSIPTSVRKISVADVLQCLSFDTSDNSLIDAKMGLQVFGDDILKGKVIKLGKHDNCKATRVTKKSKSPFLDFDKLLEDTEALDKKFVVGKRTVLSEAALEKWDPKDCIGLPPSKYDKQKLMELFTKPSYTYFGLQDTKVKQSFIDLEDGSGDDDDAADDYNVSAQFPSGPEEFSLVQVPDRVKKDNINYAKFAKKIDMQEVKAVLWEVLTSHEDIQANSSSDSSSEIRGSVDFAVAYKKLLDRLLPEARKDISVSVAFVALLHLANEHNLLLENSEDMKSLSIKQEKKL